MTVAVLTDGLAPVREFDALLGDPKGPAAVITTQRSLQLDERSEFPAEAIAAADDWGLQRYYVPAEHGGLLTDVLTPLLMVRHLARRDVTAAVIHGKSFLGSVCAWVAGGDIADRMAAITLTGAPVSWGLTEKGRGSDLSRSATSARIGDDSIQVDGAKWPISNAARGRAITVLARSDERPGPRSLSLVLVDKHEADPSTITYEPKVATHGIRGAAITGIRFDGTTVSRANLIGQPGHGLELVLKSLQLTRTMTSALSVGAADQAIAIALDFAGTPGSDGRRPVDLPIARRSIAAAVADMLLAECLMFTGARTVHEATGDMALVSALVKYLTPETVDLLFRDLTRFLGIRSQLIGFAGAGAFQKAARDNRVVGIFDGNSVVNLNVIINEFPAMLRTGDGVDLDDVLAPLRPSGPAASIPVDSLRLVTRQGSQLLRALPAMAAAADDGRTSPAVLAPARFIASAYAEALDEVAGLPRQSQPDPLAFLAAERLALTFGGAAALGFWLARRDVIPGPLGESDAWIAAVLQRIAQRLGAGPIDAAVADAVTDAALEAHAAGSVTLLDGWRG